MPNSDIAVQVEGLSVSYGDFIAVQNLNLTAHHGRVTVILGPNGAGKTSTIECCEGLRSPSSGLVRVLGLNPIKDKAELVKRMGVMLQNGGVYPSARVRETLELYTSLYGDRVEVEQLLNRFGLTDRQKSTWRQLSGGEQQRLSLALALTANPDVAFLDEPTSGVDVFGREVIRETLRELANKGCAVIVATHELDEAERVADDVVIINQGQVISSGSLEALQSGTESIRFCSSVELDISALKTALGVDVLAIGNGEFRIQGNSDAALIGQLGSWLAEKGHPITELRTGGETLSEIFTRVVEESSQ